MLFRITLAAVAVLAMAGTAEASMPGAAAALPLTIDARDAKAGALMTLGIALLNRAPRKSPRRAPLA